MRQRYRPIYDPTPNNSWRVRNKPFPYVFSGPTDPHHLLRILITAGNYVWDRQNLVSKDGKTRPRSHKSLIYFDIVCIGATIDAVAFSSKVHLA